MPNHFSYDCIVQRGIREAFSSHFSYQTTCIPNRPTDVLHRLWQVVEMALDQLGAGVGADSSLHVSFDVDALDPSEAPCTGTPGR